MYNEVVSSYEQEIEFVVGFAGSGKSTELAKRFKDSKSLVLTPTHKAKEVLLRKGVKNVATIHSLLKLVPTLNQEMRRGQKMQRLQKIGDLDLKAIKQIGIDEFSMINVEILDMLLNALPTQAKVTIFGDPYQLEPVDGELIEPETYTEHITELTTQHRAEAPEVVETFMRFKDFIKTQDHRIDLRLNDKIKHGTIEGFNPDTDRALAWTNKKVLELNERIAMHLNLPKEISVGEQVAINGLVGELVEVSFAEGLNIQHIYPKCVSKGKLMQGDKLVEAVINIERDMTKYNTNITYAPIGYIKIEDKVYSFSYDLDHYAESNRRKKIVEEVQFGLIDHHDLAKEVNLKEWCNDHRGAKLVKARGTAWKQYLLHQGLIWDFRRPFATTIHKSQGSEFSTVYIAQEDIKMIIRGKYYLKYARLMYVALSRAIHKVVIV